MLFIQHKWENWIFATLEKENNHSAEALLTQHSENACSKTVKKETFVKAAKIVLQEETWNKNLSSSLLNKPLFLFSVQNI